MKLFSVFLQFIVPQRALSRFAGFLANSRKIWLKNSLIRYFIKRYDVDMSAAIIEDPFAYTSFNHFFTRQLKPHLRPIVSEPLQIASPVDGVISQIGKIEQNTLLQAKGRRFDLLSLLGGSAEWAKVFSEGNFATFYLAPKDYHRVHLPCDAKLKETIFIPGSLFSVDHNTTENIPSLFARNERLVCFFDTEFGHMAIILVGAMLVGSIATVWHANTHAKKMTYESYAGSLTLSRGQELGLFKMGSTAIILFAKEKINWLNNLQSNAIVRFGQLIGNAVPRSSR